jgi:hypothetical protein
MGMVDKQAFDAVVTREFSATGRQRRWDAVSGETSISSVDASGATTSIPDTTSASSACGGQIKLLLHQVQTPSYRVK